MSADLVAHDRGGEPGRPRRPRSVWPATIAVLLACGMLSMLVGLRHPIPAYDCTTLDGVGSAMAAVHRAYAWTLLALPFMAAGFLLALIGALFRPGRRRMYLLLALTILVASVILLAAAESHPGSLCGFPPV